ncbi:hypothetical protein [Paracoccus aminovorans]|uniref:hypothetical protein n=1 Tax=Paracoccus aminovorans TaxID=34004 RepID=UPI000B0CD8ED|nr:hypothetical protein [Paracoccus aminovorans]MDQ7774774.1 hypothetical protein [Paracoccus aminovorans]
MVIAGDLELSLSARKLVLFFLDNFFGSDHDLVVNTALMEGGLPRHDPVLLVDRGPTVTHFGYFGNARSAAQLRDGLLAPARLRGIAPPDTQLAKAERAEKDRGVTRSPVPAETGAEAGLTLSEGPAARGAAPGGDPARDLGQPSGGCGAAGLAEPGRHLHRRRRPAGDRPAPSRDDRALLWRVAPAPVADA